MESLQANNKVQIPLASIGSLADVSYVSLQESGASGDMN